MHQMGPGMISQSQEVCGECDGKGEIIPPSSRCKTCKGKKTTKVKKVIEIEVDKGAPSDFRKVFYGEVMRKIDSTKFFTIFCDLREIMSQERSPGILSFSWRRRNTPPFRDTERI